MKKILVLLFVLSFNNYVLGAGSDSSSDSSEAALYDSFAYFLDPKSP